MAQEFVHGLPLAVVLVCTPMARRQSSSSSSSSHRSNGSSNVKMGILWLTASKRRQPRLLNRPLLLGKTWWDWVVASWLMIYLQPGARQQGLLSQMLVRSLQTLMMTLKSTWLTSPRMKNLTRKKRL